MPRGTFIFLAVAGGLFYSASTVYAAHATHLVISEVQTTGGAGKTTQDFVEVYNPTGVAVDLNGLRLVKRTATGTMDTTLKAWIESILVPAHGYYLWANSDFLAIAPAADAKTVGTIADNNGIALRRGAENSGEIIDALAWGTAANVFVEGTVLAQNPGAGQSLERKPGGAEGNGTDTGNNASDFFLQIAPNPQNAQSAPVPTISEGSTAPIATGAIEPPAEIPVFNSGDVLINEFVPDPNDGVEWIELYNKTSAAIELTGWKLMDGTEATIKTLSGTIAAQGFLVAELSSARLNNSGDRIFLRIPSNGLIDAVSYGSWNDGNGTDNAAGPAKSGQSVARKSNGGDSSNDQADFGLSDTPTKGASNVITITNIINTGGISSEIKTVVPRPRILINEFVADPEDGPEWVELYNAGEVSVDLEGWWLEDGSETKTMLSGTIVPGHFKVARDINGNLNNAGDIIRLKNEKGDMTDRVTFGAWEDGTPSDNAPVATDPSSVARRVDGKDTDNDKEDFVVSAQPTKGKANMVGELANGTVRHPERSEGSLANASILTSVRDSSSTIAPQNDTQEDVSGKLFISEIMPDPTGADSEEWLELFWVGAEPLALAGFKLDDSEGGSRPFTITALTIAPRAYALFSKAQTGLTLNNDSDAVRLFDPRGNLLEAVEYEGAKSGVAYARSADHRWTWTSKPTPGGANVIEKTEDTEEIKNTDVANLKLEEVRDLELGQRVRVQGVVAVSPGVLGTQLFYLAGSGIQVYSSKRVFPKLQLGDVVEVEGVLRQSGGETRINISKAEEIKVISHGAALKAHVVELADVGEELEGNLIQAQGIITEMAKSGFTLSDEDGAELSVTIKASTGIRLRDFVPGAQVTVVGIVGQAASGYRLMPRFQDDLEIIGQDDLDAGEPGAVKNNLPVTAASSPYAKATAVTFGGSALVGLAVRRRQLLLASAKAVWFVLRRGKLGDKV